MQNDVLKNEIAPWQEKGRWYHGVVDCVTKAMDKDKTDPEIYDNGFFTDAGNNLVYHRNNVADLSFIVLQSISKYSSDYARATAGAVAKADYFMSDGRIYPSVGVTGASGSIEFWLFVADRKN